MNEAGDSSNLSNWDEKIQKLLEQGRRLGSVETTYQPKHNTRTESQPLADDVSRLKQEIDEQNRKTLELQSEIREATENFRSSMPRRNFLSNMNNNNNNNSVMAFSHSPSAAEGSGDYVPFVRASTKEFLEKALEDSQEQVRYLNRKLEETQETTDKQKVQFRTTVEELQLKLQETIAGRKQLVQLRESEIEERDDMIHQLQKTLKELAGANQMQEQSLHESNNRLELLEKQNHTFEKALERIRAIFSSHDKIKGNPYRYSGSHSSREMSVELVVDTVERAMNDTYEEIEAMRNKIMELENGIFDMKQDHNKEVNLLSVKQQEAAEMLRIETNERVLEEKLNTEGAMKQVYSLQDELQQHKLTLASKEQEIRDVEKEMTIITTQFEELKNHYFDDKESLQNKLFEVEAELATKKQSNDTFKQECEKLKLQLAESQQHFLRTNEELKCEREQRRNLCVKDNESGKEINELRRQLDVRNAEISSLKEESSETKAQHSIQLVEKVREAELVERSKADRKSSQLNEEISHLKEEFTRTKATLESAERQISDVMVERSETQKSLQEKSLQLEKVTSQWNVAERKLVEADESRRRAEEKWEKLYAEYNEIYEKFKTEQANHDTIKSQTIEKERELVTLQLRVQSLKSDIERTKSDLDEVKIQKLNFKADLEDKTKALQKFESQAACDKRTISDYEARIGGLIQEKNRASTSALQHEDENEILKKSLESAQKELDETRTQITFLLDEKNETKKLLGEIDSKGRMENEKLRKQLKQTKRNLKDAEKSLMTIKSVDGRAARIAENMQKEVTSKRSLIDSLQTELSKAIDRLSYFERANKALLSNLEETETNHEELENSKNKLEKELKELRKSEKGYRLAVERLEKGLEKAAVKNCEAQAKINQQEKDIAQLHINHNMMLMNKRANGQIPSSNDKPLPGANLYQPNLMPAAGNVGQSILARLILNMTAQHASVADGFRQPLLTKDDNSDIHKSANRQMPVVSDNVGEDMCKLLSQVCDQLSRMEKPRRDAKHRSSSEKYKSKPFQSRVPEEPSKSAEHPAIHLSPEQSMSTVFDSSTFGSTIKDGGHESPFSVLEESTTDRPFSPVSQLLGRGSPSHTKPAANKSPLSKGRRKIDLDEMSTSIPGASTESTSDLPAESTSVLKHAITNTAEDLCRQLQDRLEGLSRMGGKLQEQNKLTEKMIKKQDAKLQKVRGGMNFR